MNNEVINNLRSRWAALDQDDQRAIRIGGLAVALILFIGLVIIPAYQSLQNLQKQVPAMRGQLSVMKAQSYEVKKLRANPIAQRSNESLLTILEKSTTAHGIKPTVQSLTPRSEKSAAIRLKSVEYSKLVKWLAGLNSQYRLSAGEAELTRTDMAGVVDAYLVFTE